MNRLLDFDNYWPPAGTTMEYKGIQCGLWYPFDYIVGNGYTAVVLITGVGSVRELLWI